MDTSLKKLTTEDEKLLIEILFNQQYELEIISSELNDIEAGLKNTDHMTYLRLVSLFDRLS